MKNDFNYKRNHPPIWQHDYHVLKRLFNALFYLSDKYIQKKVDVILDYGCGTSPYKNLFLSHAEEYIGIDLPDNNEADIKVGEDGNIPLKNESADVIISTQVLEHVERVDFYLHECRRLLKKNGLLILSTHGVWPYHPYPADYHRWTRNGLETALKNNRIKCMEIIPVLGPFASVTQFTLLLIAEKLVNKNIFTKILLLIFSLVGNCIIWLEDKLFPATRESDASLYVVCARKI